MKILENSTYAVYCRLGGIINEKDYTIIFERAILTQPNESTSAKNQAMMIIKRADLNLDTEYTEKLVTLYSVLRNDTCPDEAKHHHCQMSDQRLLAEALRMMEDANSLQKLVVAFPNIDFK